jgi:hypothetical protein
MSKKTIMLMAVATSLSLASNARAQSGEEEEAPPPPQPQQVTNPPPEPGETNLAPQQPNEVQPEQPVKLCPPFTNKGRVDHDRAPGRAAQIGGGFLIGFGLANLAVGAGIAAWGAEEGNITRVGVASAFAAAGGAAFIAGIPIAASGTAIGRRARIDHAELSLGPLPGGGTARVSVSY